MAQDSNQVIVKCLPTISRVLAKCWWVTLVNMCVSQEATDIIQHISRMLIDILTKCQSTCQSNIGQYINLYLAIDID